MAAKILLLIEAKRAEDEKKVVNIARYYEKAADMVIAAPPAEKLKVMEETFNAAVAPDPAGCPTSVTDMHKKMNKAFDGVNAAATPDKKEQVEADTLGKSLIATVILEEAQRARDEKKVVNIARSYEKAADMAIAAPPAEKLKVMQEAFNAAVAPDPTGCPTIDKSFCETKAADAAIAAAPAETLKVMEEAFKAATVHPDA
ncbi:hypothetical protein HU200_030722 [Digitaria exilis]|uniref:Uncharacterized protein n=1 Tax=Digitaria exilis TaxID=1010633 RepID=A0A835EQU3_9POAL|nr:hypothetical protein HU200_030722 [Digitaria exilis]